MNYHYIIINVYPFECLRSISLELFKSFIYKRSMSDVYFNFFSRSMANNIPFSDYYPI